MLQSQEARSQQDEGLLTDNSRFSHLSSKGKGEPGALQPLMITPLNVAAAM